ncbi:MAG: indole-3-glycerol phosphate synthase TrpC [Spirochaetia bacterium]|nr:indole-3-glycerol phosphate synthase TrpC [Spirochaetia bacterium]
MSDSGLLDRIVSVKKEEIRSLPAGSAPKVQSRFLEEIRRPAGKQIRIIAECKRTSPSSGRMRELYDPEAIAQSYAELGAAALSVLTDREFFEGKPEDLTSAKRSGLPALRKDFVIHEKQIADAARLGADAVLLIVRILDVSQLSEYIEYARSLGLPALVETHNEKEIETAVRVKSEIIGINHRDLDTLKMDLSLTPRLAPQIRKENPGIILVAESGVENAEGIATVDAFADAALIGTAFMKSTDLAATWKSILG